MLLKKKSIYFQNLIQRPCIISGPKINWGYRRFHFKIWCICHADN